jgi:hypothetical protein
MTSFAKHRWQAKKIIAASSDFFMNNAQPLPIDKTEAGPLLTLPLFTNFSMLFISL